MDIPPIDFLWGELLRPKGKLALIGQPKIGKSLFAVQLGLHMAHGIPFVGMQTRKANVLYVNFEVSVEKLQERLQDLCEELVLEEPSNLLLVTIPGGLPLETLAGMGQLESYIRQAEEKLDSSLDLLIIDPRRNAMGGDENQSAVMTAWCMNLNVILDKYYLAAIIVHHQGKTTKGAGRGSSVFDAWLDTILKLQPDRKFKTDPKKEAQPDLTRVELVVQGRDTEEHEIRLTLKFPVWDLTPEQEKANETKVDLAANFILSSVGEAELIDQKELRRKARQVGHSDYGFKQAFNQLKQGGLILVEQTPGKKGNWHTVRLPTPKI